jgi:hypothetical protein
MGGMSDEEGGAMERPSPGMLDGLDRGGEASPRSPSRTRSLDALEDERRQANVLLTEEWMRQHHILHPKSLFRKRWDMAQIVLLGYVALLVPYRIGFGQEVHPWEAMFIVDMVVDAYFIMDIFSNFRTAFYGAQGELVCRPTEIARHYLTGWFTIDLAGSLPVNYVILLVGADSAGKAKSNKFFRMLRLFRLLKLLRLLRLNRLLRKYEEQYYALASVMRLSKIALQVVLCGHFLGCTWYYLGTKEWRGATEYYASGEKIEPWVERYFGGQANGTDYTTRYATSLYWSLMTMTTVGYGDLHAETTNEKIVSLFAMSTGGFIFGLVVGSLGNLSSQSDPGKRVQGKRIGMLSAYLSDRKVSMQLTRSLRGYFNRRYDELSPFCEEEYKDYFRPLPATLRVQLAKELGYIGTGDEGGMLSKVPCFARLDVFSLMLVCSRLKTLHLDGEHDKSQLHFVFKRGDVAYDMMVVMEGSVTLEQDVTQPVITLKKGEYCDEHIALLPPVGYRREYSATVNMKCTVGFLSSEDVATLCKERGHIQQHLRPHMESARRARYVDKINAIFMEMDRDGDGWIQYPAFKATVERRRPKSKGGSAAEVFFDAVLNTANVSDSLIHDLYDEIFIRPIEDRQTQQVYNSIFSESGFRRQMDKESFASWWLAIDTRDDSDQNAEKRRAKAKLDMIRSRIDTIRKQAQALESNVHAMFR